MIWGDMVFLSRSSPAVKQCAIFLPRRKLKNEAGHHGNCVSGTQCGVYASFRRSGESRNP
jgi:hypothetical protein